MQREQEIAFRPTNSNMATTSVNISLEASVRLSYGGRSTLAILDSRSEISVVNEKHLLDLAPNAVIRRMITGWFTKRTRGNGTIDVMKRFVRLNFWFYGTRNGEPTVAHLGHEVYVTRDRDITLIIGMDILGPEQFTICFVDMRGIFGSCPGISFPITSRSIEEDNSISQPPMVISWPLPEPIRLDSVSSDGKQKTSIKHRVQRLRRIVRDYEIRRPVYSEVGRIVKDTIFKQG